MRSDLSFESAELEAEFSKLQTERNLRLTKQVGTQWQSHAEWSAPERGAARAASHCFLGPFLSPVWRCMKEMHTTAGRLGPRGVARCEASPAGCPDAHEEACMWHGTSRLASGLNTASQPLRGPVVGRAMATVAAARQTLACRLPCGAPFCAVLTSTSPTCRLCFTACRSSTSREHSHGLPSCCE